MIFSKSDLKKLIIPLMIEQALVLTVGMIDTVMVASAGEAAVSGVSLVETINVLLINLFAALSTGGAIVAGQYLGRKDKKNANHAAKQLVISTALISFVLMIFCLLLNRPLLSLVFGQTEQEVMSHARTYFYMTALSYPFIAVYNSAAALFRSMGSTKIAMVNSLIVNVLNIIGNAIFIYGFQLSVFGAALSTLISRSIGAFMMMYMLRNEKLSLYVRSFHRKDFDWSMIKRILRIGIPNGLENSMFQIGKIVVTSLVAGMGTVAIAAHAVGNSFAGIEVIPGFSMGLALTTVISRCVGANEYEQANKYIKYLMKWAFIFMILLNAVILIFLKPIVGIYNLSDQTAALAYIIMAIHGVGSMVIWPFSFTLPNAFRAAGDVKYAMVVSILSMWIFRIGGSYVLARYTDLGVLSIWVSMMFDWVIRSIFYIYRWLSGKWKVSVLN